MVLLINDMIEKSNGRELEILIELKRLNNKASSVMFLPHKNWKQKYTLLQKTHYWKTGKSLNIEYAILKGITECGYCGNKINFKKCVMHHSVELYNSGELFTPEFVIFLCSSSCHSRIHGR